MLRNSPKVPKYMLSKRAPCSGEDMFQCRKTCPEMTGSSPDTNKFLESHLWTSQIPFSRCPSFREDRCLRSPSPVAVYFFLLQVEKPKPLEMEGLASTSGQVRGPSRMGRWGSNSQDSSLSETSQHLLASLRILLGELCITFYNLGKQSCLRSNLDGLCFRRSHSRGARLVPHHHPKTWVLQILRLL